DPAGAGAEEQAEEEVALADMPGASGEVIQNKEQRRTGGAHVPAQGPAEYEEERGGDGEPAEIEEAPGEIARSRRRQHRPVQEIHAGKIHVEDVPIGDEALAQEPCHVVEQRRVMDE